MRAAVICLCLASCNLVLTKPAIGQTRAELDAANDAAYQRLESGMAELQRIDADLSAMQQNANKLRADRAARARFAQELRARHTSFQTNDVASADALYRALFDYRRRRADQLRPLAAATREYTHREECTVIRNIENIRAKATSADLRELLDGLAGQRPDRPCLASDMLPDEPASERSVERSMERFRESSRRAARFHVLAERP